MSAPALVLAALLAEAASVAEVHAGQPVMGTVLEVTVVAADPETGRRLASAAIAEARRWDDVLTTWRPKGELARLNAGAGKGERRLSPELAGVLATMRSFSRETGGAFDPAVGPLVDVWRKPGPEPDPATIAGSRLDEVLRLDGGRASLAAGARLDAGAIGKGIALDAIADLLRRSGALAAFLDFGGSSQLAVGSPPGDPAGWNLVVAGLDDGEILGTVTLRDGSVSTSRASGAGAEAGPIVDPRDGRPVEPPRLAVVLAANATAAEAWSTALVVLGPAGLRLAAEHGVEALVVDRSGVHRTPAFPLREGTITRPVSRRAG